MHFFYLDESGDTGVDLANPDQPILVLGGISVKDTGWMTTQGRLRDLLETYFEGDVPEGFELHSSQLLSPEGDGAFAGHPMGQRTALAADILDLVDDRGHAIHLIAIDKGAVAGSACDSPTVYDPLCPWPLAYDYLVTYINWFVRRELGQNARGMMIHDEKDEFHGEVERIAHERRFEGPRMHRVKWIVEFSYPVDSRQNAMIQISDLVAFCTKKFLEVDRGHRDAWPDEAKSFYARAYGKIDSRIRRKGLVERGGAGFASLNAHLEQVRATPRWNWRSFWLS